MPEAIAIHGAGNRSQEAFIRRVGTLEKRLGDDWKLTPIWWGNSGVDPDLVRAGIPAALPPPPGSLEQGVATDECPTIEEAETASFGTTELPRPGWDHVIWHGRRLTLLNVAGIAADVFLYLRKREEIHAQILTLIGQGNAQRTFNVIGHSLGGIIAVDMALSGKLDVDGLVSFGSQSAALHVLDPSRTGLPAFHPGSPIEIPHIRRWTNLWNRYDPAGFMASGVFKLAQGLINDIESRLPPKTPIDRAHSAYWEAADVVDAIRSTCGAA